LVSPGFALVSKYGITFARIGLFAQVSFNTKSASH
jgi:hypothetical protein